MPRTAPRRILMATLALGALSACDQPFDFDFRENFNGAFSTASAARGASAPRPDPDDRGIISYPNYQVAVARRGDRVAEVANRIGMSPEELASYNGLKPEDPLRANEVLALPGRVSEPSPATGASGTGPIQPPSNVDIAALANTAIDNAQPTQVDTQTLEPATGNSTAPVGVEPVRHKVVRGETAYTISRLYGVSVRSLSDWNGLGPEFTIREGQFLLIPVADAPAPTGAAAATSKPGQGSGTPTPPSAAQPLPDENTTANAAPVERPVSPNLGQTQAAKKTRMQIPVNGSIIRAYSKGKNDGIDIAAPAGTAIVAAEAGVIAAITTDADQVPIVVIKHSNDLLTVYANVDGIVVAKGDTVSRGQKIAAIRSGESNYVHFEIRKKFDSIDPGPYVN